MKLHQGCFLSAWGEIISSEGITQCDYASIGILHYTNNEFINVKKMNAKEVAFADNVFGDGSLNSMKKYRGKLKATDPKDDYFPKPTKSYLSVKENKLIKTQTLVTNSRVNITTEEKRHLGAVTRSTKYRDECVKGLAIDWSN